MNPEPHELIGDSPAMDAVRRAITLVAPTTATVLVLGETGTGKELVARAIHAGSPRRDRPFVPVNCAALAPGLVASELFGHETGAFTGAVKQRKGCFERADGGTIFLDEVGELSADAQAALLRVLQERVVERVGGGDAIPIDVRVIAATNRDLAAGVKAGRFRADLFYRLAVVPLAVPALGDRRSDVPALAAYFLRHFAAAHGRSVRDITPQAEAALAAHDWPGNVRELANVIERAVVLSTDERLAFDPGWLVGSSPAEAARTWAAQEKERLLAALRAAGGRVYGPGGAAHRLGLKPTTLYGKMRKHGIAKNPAGWA
jgi:formate hydrogenlyase transcriptional activator